MLSGPPSPSPRTGESAAHTQLKRLAVEWALAHRLSLCATEVRLPRCNYRADVAAATPRATSPHAKTAVFECKASRSDFLRDSAHEAKVRRELAEAEQRLRALREQIGQHRPDLRLGDELFPEFEVLDLRGTRHRTYEQLAAKYRIAQRKALEGTKFCKLMRWRCASLCYLVTEPEIVHPHHVPDGWGWLVRDGDALHLQLKPCLNDTTGEERLAMVERIAATATRDMQRRLGLLQYRQLASTAPSSSTMSRR